jgi:osmoprotectant transport system ATP-binding protein
MQDMLRSLLASMRKTVLLVTHDLDEALYLANRIALVAEGSLVAHLTPVEFLHSTQPEVASYIRAFHRADRAAASEGR